jgi:EAL domain-containing protein (putative c-di-GMP-specific phosphodiesterase class I)
VNDESVGARIASFAREALVVDDDPAASAVTGELLARAGFAHVRFAPDGAAALRELAGRHLGLLVCDLRMDGMDGVELLRHLAERHFSAPILVVSASHEKLLASITGLGRSHGLNLLGSLRKPLNRAALHRMLVAGGLVPPSPAPADAPSLDADALRIALDEGGVHARLQPVFRTADGALAGAEVTPRWVHPELGVLDPDRFVPLAQRSGLAPRLGEALLDRALDALRARPASAPACPLSLDVSSADLQDFGVVDRIRARVDAADVSPADLQLRVSERRLVEDSATATEVLTRLKIRGFGLAVDDFGTGWSSRALLAEIPFSEMRIDARFVMSACSDPTALAIVESSVNLARRMGMTVTAKGIEAPEHWALACRLGVDAGQGFALGAPLPAERFRERYLVA